MTQDSFQRLGAKSSTPLLCYELNPPRGTDPEPALKRLAPWVDRMDFLNVTDCALARLKAAAFPFASLAKQRLGVEPLVNLSCRDRNVLALQADLLGAWMIGVRSVVALTGDAMSVGDTPERQGVFEINSVGLLQLISTLNAGKDVTGTDLKGAPQFVCGVVANPNAKNLGVELRRLQKKRDAGGKYVLTQPVYDLLQAEEFCKQTEALGIPVLLGLMPIKTKHGVQSLSLIPGLRLPEELLASWAALPEEKLKQSSLDLCVSIAARCRPHVAGFHVVAGASPQLGLELFQELTKFKHNAGSCPLR